MKNLATNSNKSISIDKYGYNPAFINEMHTIGCKFDHISRTFTVPNTKTPIVEEIVSSYFSTKSVFFTPAQKKIRKEIVNFFGNPDMKIYKNNQGSMFIIDAHHLSGTPVEIGQDLEKLGLKVTEVKNNMRIYFTKS